VGTIKPKLSGIPETMLISLRARYLETKKKNGIIMSQVTADDVDTGSSK